jgi:hypothetical protein
MFHAKERITLQQRVQNFRNMCPKVEATMGEVDKM